MPKLRSRQEFDQVLQGAVLAKTSHFVLHVAQTTQQTAPALGCIIPKRWAKRAVTRNMIRRQIWSVAQSCEYTSWQLSHAVVRLRSAIDRTQWISAQSQPLQQMVREQLLQLFARAKKNAQKDGT